MAGESEVLVEPVSRWGRLGIGRLCALPVGVVLVVGTAVQSAWGWSLYFGVCLVAACAMMWRTPRRRVERVDDDLVVFNSLRTWRFPIATIRDVSVGKSMNGACVFVQGVGRRHAIDATLGMTPEQLEEAAARINDAVAAHRSSVGP